MTSLSLSHLPESDAFPSEKYRKDFPILSKPIHGQPLAYLDTGASAQKPQVVIDTMTRFMETDYANIHRGVYDLSQRSSDRYEEVREKVRKLIHARFDDEIIFTHGATEAFNLIAQTWGRAFLKAGDEIVITALEHHANIVPWQMLCEERQLTLRVIPVTKEGEVLIEDVKATLSSKTKIVAFAHISNVLGTILPAKEIVALAHKVGAVTVIDGCQSASHMEVDVEDIDTDFFIFSGHKIYGPTGVGVLYGKREILAQMPPYQGGGDMIASVSFTETTYKEPPHRFEAGTPPITEVVGLGAAIDYLLTIGMDQIAEHEKNLLVYAMDKLSRIKGLHIIGTAKNKSGIISFVMDQAHPHDVGTILDRSGVAVRTGHHCAQPLMEHLGLVSTTRVSFGVYSTYQDIDALIRALEKVQQVFA